MQYDFGRWDIKRCSIVHLRTFISWLASLHVLLVFNVFEVGLSVTWLILPTYPIWWITINVSNMKRKRRLKRFMEDWRFAYAQTYFRLNGSTFFSWNVIVKHSVHNRSLVRSEEINNFILSAFIFSFQCVLVSRVPRLLPTDIFMSLLKTF